MAQTSKMMCAFLLCSLAGHAHSSEPSVKALRGFHQNSSLENQSNGTGNDTFEDDHLQDSNQSQLGLQELSETSESYHHHHHHHYPHPWVPASYVPRSPPAGGCSAPCTDFVRERNGCKMTDKYACQNGQCVYQKTENQDVCDRTRVCKGGTVMTCPTRENCCSYDNYIICPDGGRRYCNDGTIPCNREQLCPGQ